MDDPFSALRSLAAASTSNEAALRATLTHFADRVERNMSGADVHVNSQTVTLEEDGSGESIYGHLFYSRGSVSVAYRRTEEDVFKSIHQESIDQTFSVTTLGDCSIRWLRALSAPAVIDSFIREMLSTLRARGRQLADNVRHLTQALNVPVTNAEAALESAAHELGYDDVLSEWHRAQDAVHLDPRDAITRASSLVETVCKHILSARGATDGLDGDIQRLLKATLKVLELEPHAQLTKDLRALSGGIVTVIHSLGALRTHEGTAHGHEPGDRPPTGVEGRLAVNLAGAAATFLMETAQRAHRDA
jgi:hypothetical protein